jgi:hypothetical protein
MGEKGQKTNLASEFYILSMFYRMGINAHLTLGNKKSVDIVIEKENTVITIDVKGMIGKTLFPMDNWIKEDTNHYLIFVSYLGKIDDYSVIPEVYIVPSKDINKVQKQLEDKPLLYINQKKNRKGIPYKRLKILSKKYKERWDSFK